MKSTVIDLPAAGRAMKAVEKVRSLDEYDIHSADNTTGPGFYTRFTLFFAEFPQHSFQGRALNP